MVTTVPKKTERMVLQKLPQAKNLRELAQRSPIHTIYIDATTAGSTNPNIQINHTLMRPQAVGEFIQQEQAKLSTAEKEKLIIALNVDEKATMGIVADIQQQLRKVNARRIIYTTVPKETLLED